MTEPTEPGTRRSMEERFPRALWIRLIIYIAVGHVFAAFIYLLFTLGGQSH
ncbi:hypothetical protein GCM10011579_023630 [Streptomyces albiflavescens]|uniref:Small hydrophobic protein n=1 Tax=Streptomyces albiflavescens TaxID=1623582 RepID=A0A917XYA7_9ACTN|nr:hypothetical protein GCM10011579_023630 [Streptomyces albiflavescens]